MDRLLHVPEVRLLKFALLHTLPEELTEPSVPICKQAVDDGAIPVTVKEVTFAVPPLTLVDVAAFPVVLLLNVALELSTKAPELFVPSTVMLLPAAPMHRGN